MEVWVGVERFEEGCEGTGVVACSKTQTVAQSSKQVDDYKLEGELGSLGKPANEMNLEWTSISDGNPDSEHHLSSTPIHTRTHIYLSEIDRYARGFDDDTEYEKRVHRRDTMWDQMVDDGNVLDSEESE
eukprot:1392490-Amorphochlora_amoeboformis.AAC.2